MAEACGKCEGDEKYILGSGFGTEEKKKERSLRRPRIYTVARSGAEPCTARIYISKLYHNTTLFGEL